MTVSYPPAYPAFYPGSEVLPLGSIPTFELDGLRFGGDQPIKVSGFDPGSVEVRNQDAANGLTDGTLFGRDTLGGVTWAFDIFTDTDTYDGALELAETFTAFWRADYLREDPGAVTSLRYWMAGRWRRVFGRPRRITTPDGGILATQGRAEMSADFVVADHLHYDDVEDSVSANLMSTTVGGFMVPFEAPILMEQLDEGYIPGVFTVSGSTKTYPVIEVVGPATDAWIETDIWRLDLRGTIGVGDILAIDTRPWSRRVTLNGTPVTGYLAPTSDLSALGLTPGEHRMSFGGWGAGDTARATMRWRAARYSL